MDISPIQSPEHNDCELKPVDMDLVDSSNSSSPIFVGQVNDWMPIDEIPLPNEHIFDSGQHQGDIISPKPIRLKGSSIHSVDHSDDEMVEIKSRVSSPEPFDEEANALRALLLAQKNSPKIKDIRSKRKNLKPKENTPPLAVDTNMAFEPEVQLLTQKPINQTEEILKKAVKRLKTKPNERNIEHSDEYYIIDDMNINTNSHYLQNNNLNPTNFINYMSESTNRLPELVPMHKPSLNMCNPNNIELTNTVYNDLKVTSKPKAVKYYGNNIQIDTSNPMPIKTPSQRKQEPKSNLKIIETTNVPLTTIKTITKQQSHIKTTLKPQNSKTAELDKSLKSLQLQTYNLLSAVKLTKNNIPTNKIVATKILNRAIYQNQVNQLKRKQLTQHLIKETPLAKKLKISSPNQAVSVGGTTINRSRLITKLDIPVVKQIIIRVGESDSETDDELGELGIIDNEYNDIASPMSLPMESPCDSPITIAALPQPCSPVINTTIVANDDSSTKLDDMPIERHESDNKINDECNVQKDSMFQAKLDEFLKNARTKVENKQKESTTKISVMPKENSANTPAAVRHLPPSSQMEYRKLVCRMKILEKQKQAKNIKSLARKASALKVTIENDKLVESIVPNNVSNVQATIPKLSESPSTPKTPPKIQTTIKDIVKETKVVEKTTTLVKKAEEIVKSAATTKPTERVNITKRSVTTTRPAAIASQLKKTKAERLIECENIHKKFSTHLLDNVTKTLNLVVAAKQEKQIKYSLENELYLLQQKMAAIEDKIEIQNSKIHKIIPEISASHKTIISLKTKCSQAEKLSMNLGKIVKGDKYKFNSTQKAAILEQSKQLSIEIKKLKNMKRDDINTENLYKIDQCIQVDIMPLTIINNTNDIVVVEEETVVTTKNNNNCDIENVQSDRVEISEQQDVTDGNDVTNNFNGEIELCEENVQKVTDEIGFQENDVNEVLMSNVKEYISPLDFRKENVQINPNGIICPFQLTGQCDDKECMYEHLEST